MAGRREVAQATRAKVISTLAWRVLHRVLTPAFDWQGDWLDDDWLGQDPHRLIVER